MATSRKTANDSVRTYRSKLKRRGLRQVNFWLPDTRSLEFKKECLRQSRLVAGAEKSEPVHRLLEVAAGSVEGWT